MWFKARDRVRYWYEAEGKYSLSERFVKEAGYLSYGSGSNAGGVSERFVYDTKLLSLFCKYWGEM